MKPRYYSPVCEFKSLDDAGLFCGYASVFGVLDEHGDRVAPGAFTESLKGWQQKSQMPKLLWQHKANEPIGMWNYMKEDDQGLYVEGRLLLDIQRAKEAYALLKASVLDGLSIGYRVVESYRCPETHQRVLTKLELLEVSLVTFAANPHARIRQVKSAEEGQWVCIEQEIRKLSAILLK